MKREKKLGTKRGEGQRKVSAPVKPENRREIEAERQVQEEQERRALRLRSEQDAAMRQANAAREGTRRVAGIATLKSSARKRQELRRVTRKIDEVTAAGRAPSKAEVETECRRRLGRIAELEPRKTRTEFAIGLFPADPTPPLLEEFLTILASDLSSAPAVAGVLNGRGGRPKKAEKGSARNRARRAEREAEENAEKEKRTGLSRLARLNSPKPGDVHEDGHGRLVYPEPHMPGRPSLRYLRTVDDEEERRANTKYPDPELLGMMWEIRRERLHAYLATALGRKWLEDELNREERYNVDLARMSWRTFFKQLAGRKNTTKAAAKNRARREQLSTQDRELIEETVGELAAEGRQASFSNVENFRQEVLKRILPTRRIHERLLVLSDKFIGTQLVRLDCLKKPPSDALPRAM